MAYTEYTNYNEFPKSFKEDLYKVYSR